MVSLRRNNVSHFCGGSIISKRYILTAGHCLLPFTDPESFKNLTVHTGTNRLSKSGYVYIPEEVIVHPDYGPYLIYNDIYLGEFPDKLQKVNLKVYSQSKCKSVFLTVKSSQICAFSQLGQGACHGDFGSPLVANGIQIGLSVYVRPCARGFPDVYTRVFSFTNWLAQYISV
ncbi:Chymotrypsin-2 [Trachymyrmex zeteki]|uniref:Chymotrypsin-2 n=1 Tax=Mycetomoellerius zeteki TaxID=64791 RepID=A0A151XAC6_9HYME|nr:Chymotrypsin-2 [Trachymyrmex zeteki]